MNETNENPFQLVEGGENLLTDEQEARLAALALVEPLLVTKSMGVTRPPRVEDLIRLADWVINHGQHSGYPFTVEDTIVLGPDVYVGLDGEKITWQGTVYIRQALNGG